ncbi:putative peroxidase-related enzyme [Geodermatophilus normandii]|uniref:Putative peroxidase-related enzyme n=1 Tax=Geodermatophilus normandii TaxID=1137989 RepID=A0A317QKB1_9ACTN|nr:carboxymuconolactone decarboxylase family protein [Geodermatophilus normandii]PWW23284.1 putative peroxidase-related enzyme [Geodermatophilus normandii]
MTWISTPQDDASPEVAAAYDRDRETLGYVATYTRVFATRPPVLEAWRALIGAIRSSMDPRRYELATLAAALRLRSSYCSLAHGRVLAEQFDGPEAVVEAATDPARAPLSEVDRAVMRLADRVASGAADMTEDDLAELRGSGLDDAEVLDVVLAAAARCFFSTVLDAVGARPDAAYSSLDPAVRDALTVGRPIAAT